MDARERLETVARPNKCRCELSSWKQTSEVDSDEPEEQTNAAQFMTDLDRVGDSRVQ